MDAIWLVLLHVRAVRAPGTVWVAVCGEQCRMRTGRKSSCLGVREAAKPLHSLPRDLSHHLNSQPSRAASSFTLGPPSVAIDQLLEKCCVAAPPLASRRITRVRTNATRRGASTNRKVWGVCTVNASGGDGQVRIVTYRYLNWSLSPTALTRT